MFEFGKYISGMIDIVLDKVFIILVSWFVWVGGGGTEGVGFVGGSGAFTDIVAWNSSLSKYFQ